MVLTTVALHELKSFKDIRETFCKRNMILLCQVTVKMSLSYSSDVLCF